MTDGSTFQFSLIAFAVAAVTVGVGAAAGLAAIPVVGSYIGMLLGAFVAGLAIEERPLLEAGFAAALASLGILAAGPLVGNSVTAVVSALGSIPPMDLLTATILSFAVGAFGAHFGDDFRNGLTAPVETTPSRQTPRGEATVPPTDVEAESEQSDTNVAVKKSNLTENESASQNPETAEADDLELEQE